MCTFCITKPLHYGEVLPGWFLMKANKDANPDSKEPSWKAGQWGLIVLILFGQYNQL